MADPYVGEIRTVGFNYAPANWALCNGQILPITQNTPLFALIGTYYGGNGQTTFALPNLNGAFIIGQGEGPGLSSRFIGQHGGTAAVTLTQDEMPRHSHQARAVTAAGTTGDPAGKTWAQTRYGRAARDAYGTTANTTLAPNTLAPVGNGLPHENMPPFLGMYYIISLTGVFPPRD